ncbi:MAG: endonuclease domain-containing protein, partial [Acidobacteriota bacterium]
MWSQIRDRKVHGVKFRRQEPIGHFIVDYLAVKERLIVELDGGQHAQSTAMDRDAQRTRYLEHMGYRVLRFWNNEVLQNTAGVLEAIGYAIKERRDQP